MKELEERIKELDQISDKHHVKSQVAGIRFIRKDYPKLDDDSLYDLVCNFYCQINWLQPSMVIWFGHGMSQWPPDFLFYQDLLWKVKPTLLIESGTGCGGCTLFFASVLDYMVTTKQIKNYKIITIDLPTNNPISLIRTHPNIIYLEGDTVSQEIIEKVKSCWNREETTVVFLDSDHDCRHVIKEMEAYGPLVSAGSYMVVEDTYLGYTLKCSNGPLVAVEHWMKTHDNWRIDRYYDRWLLTQHPCGWLKKIRIPGDEWIQHIHKLPWEKFLEATVKRGHGYYVHAIHKKAIETKAKTIVELGVHSGESTRALLKAAIENKGHLYSIEVHPRPWLGKALKSGPDHLDTSFWTFIQGNDLEVVKEWTKTIDFLFIDTSHIYEQTLKELETYSKLIVQQGVILLHDIRHPPVKHAIEVFTKHHTEWEFEDVTPPGDGWGLGLLRRT